MAIPAPPNKQEETEETPESIHLEAISADTESIVAELKRFNDNFEKLNTFLRELADNLIPKG